MCGALLAWLPYRQLEEEVKSLLVMNYCISSKLATKTSNFWYGILKSHFLQVGIIRKIIRRESEMRKFQRRWLPIFIVKFNVTKFNSVV